MATTQIKAELIVNNAKWQAGLEKANRQMKGFGKSMKTVSNGIKGAIAFMGLNAIGDGLLSAAKAADEDAKSMRVLNKVLANSWKATKEQTEIVDDFIQSTSMQVGIVDDKLRPAFAKIATTIKNPTKAMKVFEMALDTAAGTGKDLNVVSLAMAKFFGGQTSALDKLVPGIKNADDKMKFLRANFAGAAKEGAGAFDKIQVAIENVQEQIGEALLPKFQELAEWMGSAEGKEAMDQWASDLQTLIKLASEFLGLVRDVAGIFDFKTRDYNTGIQGSQQRQRALDAANRPVTMAQQNATLGRTGNMSNVGSQSVVVNVYAPNVSGPAVLDALKKTARRKGVPLKLLVD